MNELNRRSWGVGIAAGVAALGAGAWWRTTHDEALARPLADPTNAPPAAGPAAATTPLPAPLAMLDGKTLAASDIAGRAVVLNFWAPWCPPCVKEMPELDRFARSAQAGHVLVIGLAIDERAAVDKFLAAHPVGFPISVLGYGGLGRVRQLGNDGGALPFTVVFDRSQKLVRRKMGATTAAELFGWTKTL